MAIDKEGQLLRIDYGDRVYFDGALGIAGTDYPIGTASMPSDVIADIITICAARNLRVIDVHGILVLGGAMNHYSFIGHCHESIADTLSLNGQDVDNSRFDNCMITGAQGGAGLATYMRSILYNTSGIRGVLENCAIFGTLAVATGDADYADFDHCTSVHGNITVTIASPDRVSFKHFTGGMILTAQAAGAVLVRGISGYLEVDAMVGGTLDIYAHGADIQINADCTAGTINIYGDARVTDLSAAGCTVNNYVERLVGVVQIAATTIDLNQGIASYDLFTGTTQAVILESLNIKMPTGAAGGALTSISIQTDDATPGVIISAVTGAVANLTSEADLGWTGTLYITVGTKIQLSIAGGAHGAAYVCNVTAKCRAVVSGGYLA